MLPPPPTLSDLVGQREWLYTKDTVQLLLAERVLQPIDVGLDEPHTRKLRERLSVVTRWIAGDREYVVPDKPAVE